MMMMMMMMNLHSVAVCNVSKQTFFFTVGEEDVREQSSKENNWT
jgi:hypothetical protein